MAEDDYMKQINEKIKFYNKHKSVLPQELTEKINKDFNVRYTYDSTTIEGNTLSLIETKAVLEDNISIGGKELREIYEVTNHNKAFEYIKEKVAKQEELDEETIKDIHQILVENIMQGGIYRSTDVNITGANHTPPTPNDMYNQLQIFYEDIKANAQKMDPIELAAWTHAEFVRIHPFVDGNGRTSRLIMNYQLIKNELLPINIKVEDRLEYYNHLDVYATTRNLEPFTQFIAKLEEERLEEINKLIRQQLEANPEG